MFSFYVYDKNLMNIREKSMQELKFCTIDKINIAVNHYESGFKSVLIIAPGWFMTKDSKSFKEMSEEFSKYTDVISMDFRGHGKSSGFYTFTSKEVIDINAVINFAQKRYEKIYLMGFSLGSSIVLTAGAENKCVNKIIAVSAPVCFEKIENKVWKKEAWLPTFQKFELKRWFSIRPGLLNGKKVKPIDIVDKITCPTLFIAGEKDPTVCSWHTEALFNKAVCKKDYKLFKNCCHAEDLFIQDRENFIKICINWLFSE
ncbi:MAG: alpha/beta hydrolase [Candidatus Gastranaerophilales bacterium]|nr:alpha/beta hydrolase [Candidatus Gastranaerophilales bacterium]